MKRRNFLKGFWLTPFALKPKKKEEIDGEDYRALHIHGDNAIVKDCFFLVEGENSAGVFVHPKDDLE